MQLYTMKAAVLASQDYPLLEPQFSSKDKNNLEAAHLAHQSVLLILAQRSLKSTHLVFYNTKHVKETAFLSVHIIPFPRLSLHFPRKFIIDTT